MNRIVSRAAVTIAAAAALCGIGAGAADATTATTHSAPGPSAAENVPSMGIHLHNHTTYRYVLTAIDGDTSAGAPRIGSELNPKDQNPNDLDFEVRWHAFANTHMIATFDMYNWKDVKIATIEVDMAANAFGYPTTDVSSKSGDVTSLWISRAAKYDPAIENKY
jgi:hypothetical protein